MAILPFKNFFYLLLDVGRFWLIFIALLTIFLSSFAKADVTIDVRSSSDEVNENVLAHIGRIDSQEKENKVLAQRRAIQASKSALNALGYYESEISTTWIKDDKLLLQIELGEPVRFRKITVELEGPARIQPEFSSFVEAPLLVPGRPLKHWLYEQTKEELTQALSRFGYLDAYLKTADLAIDTENKAADVTLIAVSGERYRFGEVNFDQEGLSESLLRRYLNFSEGEYFDNDKIAEFRKQLSLSGYFDDVQLLLNKDENKRVDMRAKLVVKESHFIDVGLGYSTDTDLRAKLGWRWPVSGEFGGALSASSEISEPKTEVTVNYRIPLVKPQTQSLDLDYGWQDKKVENTRTILTTLGAAFNNLRENNWQHRYGISIDYERHSPEGEDIEKSFFLVPSLTWTRTETNDPVDPDSGYYLTLGVEASHPGLGSDTQFIKGVFGVRWLTKVYSPKFVLVSRLNLGAIATDNIEQVPFSRRFFAGGDQSIRGFEYESISTRDEDGNLIGGKFLNVGSVELNYRILDEWRLGVFFDAGRAYSDQDEPLYSSIGPSARWLSPIGQIRLDLAFPLKGEDSSDPRVHLSMGGVF